MLVHEECSICSILNEEQKSGNLRPVSAVLNLIQRLPLFFCHVMCCWCLHGVALLGSEVFHGHVDVSGVVLMPNSKLSPVETFCSTL